MFQDVFAQRIVATTGFRADGVVEDRVHSRTGCFAFTFHLPGVKPRLPNGDSASMLSPEL